MIGVNNMAMNLFERTSSNWVRYSEYEWKTAEDGTLFLTPTKTAQPSIYDPLSEYQRIVLDAINIGRMESQKKTPQEIQKAIQQFAVKYGLLGLMTALPTTPSFMDYEAVYLPKNHFIREESMSTMDYLNLFFPFDKPDVVKRGVESMWNISNDRVMMALAMTMTDKPMAVNMSFQREYAERYEWMKQQFIDIAFTYLTSVLFYEDYDTMTPEQRLLMQQGMEAFGGIAPKSVRPQNIRSSRLSNMARSTRKYSCSGPTSGRTIFTSSMPKSFSTRSVCLLSACIERSSGVFLSSASPP